MQHWIFIIAGLVGTLVMTGTTELVATITRMPFHVIRILASMLPFQKHPTPPNTKTFSLAVILHYTIGVVFAYGYVIVIGRGWFNADLLSSILYGVIIGTIAIAGWRLFFLIHPNPPPIPLKGYLPVIWTGHIVLSLTFYVVLKHVLHAGV